jgi:hypothetical protein
VDLHFTDELKPFEKDAVAAVLLNNFIILQAQQAQGKPLWRLLL